MYLIKWIVGMGLLTTTFITIYSWHIRFDLLYHPQVGLKTIMRTWRWWSYLRLRLQISGRYCKAQGPILLSQLILYEALVNNNITCFYLGYTCRPLSFTHFHWTALEKRQWTPSHNLHLYLEEITYIWPKRWQKYIDAKMCPCHDVNFGIFSSLSHGLLFQNIIHRDLRPLLSTRIKYNPNMEKSLHPSQNVEWDYLSIPEIQPLHHWILGNGYVISKYVFYGYNCLSRQGLKLIHAC